MSIKQITTGQDSFLDIVANLVGVLIILVVVVGAQAKTAWQPKDSEPVADRSEEILQLQTKLQSAGDQVHKLEIDNHLLEDQITQEVTINLSLGEQRHQMLVQIEMVQQELEKQRQKRREQLNQQQLAQLDRQAEQRQLEIQLAEIERETNAVAAASQPKSETIDHYPNPIAKTVFAEEVHFQLRAGKLAYVPLEELVLRMKSEWKNTAEQLRQSYRTVETVGPINNFLLQYALESETLSQPGPQGTMQQKAIRFDGFTIFPSSENVGTPVEQSLTGPSEFRDVLRRFPPGKTTVSVWIYPDSYAEYSRLKSWLYEQRYQIACWPLDADKHISGGPNGLRTSAQ